MNPLAGVQPLPVDVAPPALRVTPPVATDRAFVLPTQPVPSRMSCEVPG
jgi:hypothetical protein